MPQQVEVWTLRKVLDWTTSFFERKNVDPPRLVAELLLAHVLKCQRIRLYTDLHRPMNPDELATIRDLVRRAGEQEPIQYITSVAHFYNLEFTVTKDVLIPRSDTETLVERTLSFLKADGIVEPRVLDLCTGSGCVACAIAAHAKSSQVIATDISLPALDVARGNVQKLKLDGRVVCLLGDLFEALKSEADPRPFHAIVSNPPYIASTKIPTLDRNVRDFEPHLALDGGADGLDPHRRIVAGAYDRLVPGGRIFLEIAFDQEEAALWLLNQDPRYDDARSYRDLAGQPRVVSARKKS
ncbi:MAG: peptide chain release factor N(5)-glutamine methyltransferase [Tepidisphaeraceae bacterium]